MNGKSQRFILRILAQTISLAVVQFEELYYQTTNDAYRQLARNLNACVQAVKDLELSLQKED